MENTLPPTQSLTFWQKTKLYFKQHKKTAVFTVIVIVVIGGYLIYKGKSGATSVSYVTAPVQQGTITSSVSGTGQMAASSDVNITPQGSGTITAVDVVEGQSVKAGQTLVTLDETSAQNQINSAQAALASAQASYDNLMAGATSQQLELSNLSVQSAQQALTNAQTNYTQVQQQQALAVQKAYQNLLTDNLQAVPSGAPSSGTVTISGSYTATTEGSYTINLYQAGGGNHYTASGLGSGTGPIDTGLPQPIGNGLYATFSTTGDFAVGTTWTINLPNTESSSYNSDLSAYTSAQQSESQALASAQQQIDSAQNQLLQAQTQASVTAAPPTDASVESAKAQIQSAQVTLQNAETAYQDNIVTAPFDGIVATLTAQLGQQAGSGTALGTMITNQQLAQITLNEVDAAKVAVGQKVVLTFSALPNLSLTGEVAEVDAVGTVTQNVVNFTVKIALDEQNSQVKPGMSVSANIITAADQGVLMVPSAAVKTAGSQSYVQILVNGKPQQVPVTTGLSNNTDTEISGNIQAGQQVVTQTITSTAAKAATAQTSLLQGLTGGARAGAGAAAGGFGGGATFRAAGGAAAPAAAAAGGR
jgi:RND family efflux transporter MFP subunit